MNQDGLSKKWYENFIQTVQAHEAANVLKEASQSGELGKWTEALTGVVISTLPALGWQGAALGHRSSLLPEAREEYLALDVVAFKELGERRWRFPEAVFELENSKDDDRVAYSLWKVLCVRANLRVVFCYRRDPAKGAELVNQLSETVVRSMEINERANVSGETMVVVGTRSETASFPYGFFKEWILDSNTGHFHRS